VVEEPCIPTSSDTMIMITKKSGQCSPPKAGLFPFDSLLTR